MQNKSILREISEKVLALALVLVMLIAVIPAMNITVDAAEESDLADTAASITSGSGTWIADKLTYSYSVATAGKGTSTSGATGSVSASGNTLTVKATSAKQYDSGGCSSTTYTADDTTTSVTVTNKSTYPLLVDSLTKTGSANVSGLSVGDVLNPDGQFVISVTSPANGTNATEKTGTVTIAVSEQTSVSVPLMPSPFVSYTINGVTVEQNGDEDSFEAEIGDEIALPSISAPSGYEFKGWKIGSDITTASSFTVEGSFPVFPVIVSEGASVTGDNFKVGSKTFTFWEDAITAAVNGSDKKIVVNQDFTLPSNVIDNLLSTAGGT